MILQVSLRQADRKPVLWVHMVRAPAQASCPVSTVGCGGYIPHQQNLQTTKRGLERAQRLKVPQTPKFQPNTHMPNTGKQRQKIHWGFLAAGLTEKQEHWVIGDNLASKGKAESNRNHTLHTGNQSSLGNRLLHTG